MLVCIFGTPSPLTQAVLKVAQAVATVGLGTYEWIAAGTEKDLREAWARRANDHVLLFGDIPSREIVRLVIDSGAPAIVVIDEIGSIVRSCIRERKIEGLRAIRFTSQSLGTLHDLSVAPLSNVLGPDVAQRRVHDLAVEIASVFRIAIEPGAIVKIDSHLKLNAAPSSPLVAHLLPAPQEPAMDEETLAGRVLAGYGQLHARQTADCFDWPPEVFLGAKPHGAPIEGPVSLVGGKRCFLFGPFFHLPTGRWKATIQFEVSENISGNVLKVDIYTDRVITEASARLPVEGRLSCNIVFDVDEPRLPLQIRLFNDEGAIEGVFELFRIIVTRAT